jgi:prevent-host-death family protein
MTKLTMQRFLTARGRWSYKMTRASLMTQSVNIADAKARLSALIDRAAAGEEIILSRAGRPVARLMPLEEQTPRRPGLLKDWQIPDDLFLEPMDAEDLRAAEGVDTDEYGISLPRSK